MNMGKQIRANRLRCNLTQERLAQLLGVTAQAVSKWENDASLPDTALLPELSSVFGVKIDALFDCPEETHLRRIEAMLEREPMLPRADFDYAVAQVREGLEQAETKGRCLTLLADLYLHRSQGYAALAAEHAKQALAADPENKDNHLILSKACGGVLPDWGYSNHTRLISYYKDFVEQNPDYLPGYLWLMDNLIADHRLNEARAVLEQMRGVQETYHYLLYKGWIAFRAGDPRGADQLWQEMTRVYGDNWFAWSARADSFAHRAMYREAIDLYREAVRRQTPPRFPDNEDSIAQLCLLLGDYAGAAQAYQNVLDILREDWGLTEGETVRGYEENIRACQQRL